MSNNCILASQMTGGKQIMFTLSLIPPNWINNTQTLYNVNLFNNGYIYTIAPIADDCIDYAAAEIYADNIETNGEISFHCSTVPNRVLKVIVLMENSDIVIDNISINN